MAEPREKRSDAPSRRARSNPLRGFPRRLQRSRIDQDPIPTEAVQRSSPTRATQAFDLVKTCAQIAEDNRASEVVVLDLRKATPLVDYFVLATAVSSRQANAIAIEIDATMKKLGEQKLGIEGSEEGRWVLLDYGDFVVHLFSEDAREYYSLDELWGDAITVDWKNAPPEAPPAPEAGS